MDREEEFKSKAERIRSEMSYNQQNHILLSAMLDYERDARNEQQKQTKLLTEINERQKKENKHNVYLVIMGLVLSYLAIHIAVYDGDKETIRAQLNAVFDFFCDAWIAFSLYLWVLING